MVINIYPRIVLILALSWALSCAAFCQTSSHPSGGSGGGSGTVTRVDETVPSWLSIAGSPITTSGTLAISPATGQTSHRVIGTCGTATSFAPCALVSGDIPTLNQDTTGTASNLSGTPALPNGTTATTQTQADGSTKVATTAYTDTGLATKAASTAATTVNGQSCALSNTCTVTAAPSGNAGGGLSGTYPNPGVVVPGSPGDVLINNAGALGAVGLFTYTVQVVPPIISAATGLNDLSLVDRTYTDTANPDSSFDITISTTGTPDLFTWNKNGGAQSSPVAITGSPQTLSDGVRVQFAATTGHTGGSAWHVKTSQCFASPSVGSFCPSSQISDWVEVAEAGGADVGHWFRGEGILVQTYSNYGSRSTSGTELDFISGGGTLNAPSASQTFQNSKAENYYATGADGAVTQLGSFTALLNNGPSTAGAHSAGYLFFNVYTDNGGAFSVNMDGTGDGVFQVSAPGDFTAYKVAGTPGVTASGTSCTITAIVGGLITAATCTP